MWDLVFWDTNQSVGEIVSPHVCALHISCVYNCFHHCVSFAQPLNNFYHDAWLWAENVGGFQYWVDDNSSVTVGVSVGYYFLVSNTLYSDIKYREKYWCNLNRLEPN